MSFGHLLAIHDSEAMAPVVAAAVEPIAVDLAAAGLVAVVLNTLKSVLIINCYFHMKFLSSFL